MKNIFFIQDLATPHINRFVKYLLKDFNNKIYLYYSSEIHIKKYNWLKNKIPDDIQMALSFSFPNTEIYGTKLNKNFIQKILRNSNEIIILVGWMNINTLLLHLIFFILKKKFIHLTDFAPNYVGDSIKNRFKNLISHNLLKYSKCLIITTSKNGFSYFNELIKNKNRVVLQKLPWVSFSGIENQKTKILNLLEYKKNNQIIISCGSRLVKAKGFDLLIDSIALLNQKHKKRIKVFIAGSGDEEENLKNLTKKNFLEDNIFFVGWLKDNDFATLIYNSDLFIHSARKDAYGSTNIALNIGVPVFGSKNAGAAVDNIENKRNGMLYDPENKFELTNLIESFLSDKEFREKITNGAKSNAIKNDVSYDVSNLKDNIEKYFD